MVHVCTHGLFQGGFLPSRNSWSVALQLCVGIFQHLKNNIHAPSTVFWSWWLSVNHHKIFGFIFWRAHGIDKISVTAAPAIKSESCFFGRLMSPLKCKDRRNNVNNDSLKHSWLHLFYPYTVLWTGELIPIYVYLSHFTLLYLHYLTLFQFFS